MNYWQIEENRALYQYGFWWEVVLHYDEWVVWPAINLNKWPIYGPFFVNARRHGLGRKCILF